MNLRIADTFTDSLARLTGDEQKAVKRVEAQPGEEMQVDFGLTARLVTLSRFGACCVVLAYRRPACRWRGKWNAS